MTVQQITQVACESDMEITAPVDGAVRAKKMLLEYLLFGTGETLSIHGGICDNKPTIVVEFASRQHIFFTFEARLLAESLEKTIHSFPTFHANNAVADLVMALRLSADSADKLECSTPSTS